MNGKNSKLSRHRFLRWRDFFAKKSNREGVQRERRRKNLALRVITYLFELCIIETKGVNTMEDTLVIGYDSTDNKDWSTLLVTRHRGTNTNIINAFFGEDAENLYKKLIGREAEKSNDIL